MQSLLSFKAQFCSALPAQRFCAGGAVEELAYILSSVVQGQLAETSAVLSGGIIAKVTSMPQPVLSLKILGPAIPTYLYAAWKPVPAFATANRLSPLSAHCQQLAEGKATLIYSRCLISTERTTARLQGWTQGT